ncbi:Putative flavin monooxygenase, FAD/NAD(P)-binding domain superfamily [Septoria linicola]|uniref:Flavin monooxygenase, FAD/NAD(P)-binding domain superfamily n=1 Tax=Septoria linicola TaxID=215465 RepID=A0A9Q9B6A3_9PEZI|nr:putative flavin monooxygenase, FAD/NAD(P)-binding domain superfamily [Septoria linicola]USW59020.1 Putative flavin monooxygenase, FAD/NAD(P)-binding domain superfamily [Septoria linicola]
MGSRGEHVPYLNDEVPVVQGSQPNGANPEVHELTKDASSAEVREDIHTDVIVIGAGFSGITAIDRLRKQGLTVKCFESGDSFGGVWYWNRYPGARVDSEMPFYQLNIPEVYKTWSFSERFPGHEELRKYIAHIDQTLDLSKDTYFNARVNEATRDETDNVWTIKTLQGHVAKAKYLILATGLLHRTYTPDFPGLDKYKGALHHSGAWPEDFDAAGKKIGLIGAGATAVQITQELGKKADELTVFLRRPSYNLPMGQRKLTEIEQTHLKMFYPTLFRAGRDSATGFPAERVPKGIFDVSDEEREAHFERTWNAGGFHFALSGYNDTVIDPKANEEQYKFWRKKVCQRLTDPEKQKIMAPEKKPYYMGTKRSPLEQDYYEVLNQSNVHIHDLGASPLKEFYEKGLITADGKEHEFDAVVLATGFDSFTGSLTKLGLKNKDGVDLKDLWSEGVSTYLGITISGFPNAFMAYTPQAPTALSNGPTIIEAQVEMIVDAITKLESEGVKTIEPKREAEMEWKAALDEMSKYTLFPFTDSWWNGSNIPGKKAENMNYIAGIDVYEKQCRATFDDWKGFEVIKAN